MSASPIKLKLADIDQGREFYLAKDSGKFPANRYKKVPSLVKMNDDPIFHVHAPPGQILAIDEENQTVHLFPENTLVYD